MARTKQTARRTLLGPASPIVLDPKVQVWWEEMLRALEISESFERYLRFIGPGRWTEIRARSTAARQDIDFELRGKMDKYRQQLRYMLSEYTLDGLLEFEEHAQKYMPDKYAAGFRAYQERRAHVMAQNQKNEEEEEEEEELVEELGLRSAKRKLEETERRVAQAVRRRT